MAYQVLTANNGLLILDTDSGLSVQVYEKKEAVVVKNTAYCLATLYRIKGGFIPEKVFRFQALQGTNLDTLKRAVDFFFGTLLETDLYIKEVPPDSTLFAEEATRIYGINETQVNDGTISLVWAGRTK